MCITMNSCVPELFKGGCCHPESWKLSLVFSSLCDHNPWLTSECHMKSSMDSRHKVLIETQLQLSVSRGRGSGAAFWCRAVTNENASLGWFLQFCLCDFICLDALLLSGLLWLCQHGAGSPARNHEKKWLPFCSLIKICQGCSATLEGLCLLIIHVCSSQLFSTSPCLFTVLAVMAANAFCRCWKQSRALQK